MIIEAHELKAGQTFATKYDKLTAIADAVKDRFSQSGGYKVLCIDTEGNELYHLFAATSTVNVIA